MFIVLFAADVVLVRLNDLVPAAPVCVYLLLVLLLMGLHLVLLQLIRPSSVCLGLVRLGPQTQWPTFTAADCGCCSRNLPFTANLDPPSLGSSGIHNSSYRSRTFSYLFSQICGIFPCPDFFLLLVPLLFSSVASSPLQFFPSSSLFPTPPLLCPLGRIYQQIVNLFSMKNTEELNELTVRFQHRCSPTPNTHSQGRRWSWLLCAASV